MWGYHDGGWWIGMMAWMLIFWLAVIFTIVWVVAERWRNGGGDEAPEAILARRLALGEIDEEQYHRLGDEIRTRGRAGGNRT